MVEVPGYRIVRELARGGMATVYLAEQCSLQRQVALKVLAEDGHPDRELRRRFLREGRVAAGLHHRHIVAVHDVGECDGTAYIAMEYLPLGPVTPLCGRIAAEPALRCIAEIGLALDHAHARGVVHRDVKPGNILRHEDGAFMLGDFGIAHLAAASTVLTRQGQSAGTPAYMAPELWRDGPVQGAVDFYALGCVLFHLLTGRPPYDGGDGWAIGMQHMNAPLPQLPASFHGLQGLLARLLAKHPADRVASGAALNAHIDALRRDGHVPGIAASAGPPAGSEAQLHEWPFLGEPATPVDPPTASESPTEALDAGPRVAASSPDPPASARLRLPLPRPWRATALVVLLGGAAFAMLHTFGSGADPVAAGSEDAFGAYQRGLQLLEQGSGPAQTDQALVWFRQALARDPALARAHVGACRAQARQYDFSRDAAALEAAAADCERAAQLDPSLPELALAQGHLALSGGDADVAERHFSRALDNPLTRVEAHLRLAQLAAGRDDPDTALAHFDAARTIEKGNWRVHYARANFHAGRGQLQEAAQAYREAAALAPDSVASPWTNLGAVYLMQHDYAAASDALYRSITAEPSHTAISNLGTVRFYLGDFAEAAALYRRAIALAPSDYRSWGNLGDAASQLPEGSEEAQRSYRRAAEEVQRQLAINPRDAGARATLGWYLANLGDGERALALLAEAEQALGADAVAVEAAQIHARLGEQAQARDSVARALRAGTPVRMLAAIPVLAPVLAGMDTRVLAGDPHRDEADGDSD